MPYQDQLSIHGDVTRTGDRECATRYEAIYEHVLSKFQRPFTILDIGASEAYFSIRSVWDCDCVAVMFESAQSLRPQLEELDQQGLILLQRRVTLDDLRNMARCEHFDVVLALNVLHHFPAEDVEEALLVLSSMTQELIVETPPRGDIGACGQKACAEVRGALTSCLRRKLIAVTPRHTADLEAPMWHIRCGSVGSIRRGYVDSVVPLHSANHITSTYEEKMISFASKDEYRAYLPGINLRTYQFMGGVYPDMSTIKGYLEAMTLPDEDGPPHDDIRPWNMVLGRDGITLIDGYDGRGGGLNDTDAYAHVVQVFS